ncbi:inner membrane protein YdcO, partial [Klebsiella michiganensis]
LNRALRHHRHICPAHEDYSPFAGGGDAGRHIAALWHAGFRQPAG